MGKAVKKNNWRGQWLKGPMEQRKRIAQMYTASRTFRNKGEKEWKEVVAR